MNSEGLGEGEVTLQTRAQENFRSCWRGDERTVQRAQTVSEDPHRRERKLQYIMISKIDILCVFCSVLFLFYQHICPKLNKPENQNNFFSSLSENWVQNNIIWNYILHIIQYCHDPPYELLSYNKHLSCQKLQTHGKGRLLNTQVIITFYKVSFILAEMRPFLFCIFLNNLILWNCPWMKSNKVVKVRLLLKWYEHKYPDVFLNQM